MHIQTLAIPDQGGLDKVTRSCDKNVDESAILRIASFSVELINLSIFLFFCIAVWCLVYIGKSKPGGINSSAFDFCVLQNY